MHKMWRLSRSLKVIDIAAIYINGGYCDRVGQEKGPQTHDHNYVKSQPILGFFTGRFLGKFAVKWILKSQRTLYMLLHHLVKHQLLSL